MPTSAKLRLIADLMDDGGAFEVRTNGDPERAWYSPDTMRPDDFIADRWEVRRKELLKWALPPPPAGKQWHREDWTEEMLPEGWRPLLLGEKFEVGDQFFNHNIKRDWVNAERSFVSDVRDYPNAHPKTLQARTRRPLPTELKLIPLGPEDAPPGSAIQFVEMENYSASANNCWASVIGIQPDGVCVAFRRKTGEPDLQMITFEDLMPHKIKRPGSDWQPCSKLAP